MTIGTRDVATGPCALAPAAAVPSSSVREPRQELGRRAAGLLLDEARGNGHPDERLVLEPTPVVRGSRMVRHSTRSREGTA